MADFSGDKLPREFIHNSSLRIAKSKFINSNGNLMDFLLVNKKKAIVILEDIEYQFLNESKTNPM